MDMNQAVEHAFYFILSSVTQKLFNIFTEKYNVWMFKTFTSHYSSKRLIWRNRQEIEI